MPKFQLKIFIEKLLSFLPSGTGAASLALTSFNLFGLVKIEL